ncbi:MAG: DUF3068 domain-containing protein [Gordonia sp. (in: high G+C Gram-positive bacteria)]|uniref:DUF3068 domain-containing protein n=1 Tax=Gordonia sp. (in: high G+C Gram-positive bacteria) TaxID=84139 RepID=UPI0039E25BD4
MSTRATGRDLLGPALIFFGALLLAAALAVGPVLGGQARKLPLSTDQSWTADGADGTQLLDRCSLDRDRAAVTTGTVHQDRRILTVQPSDGSTITLQAGTALRVDKPQCEEETLNATLDRVTLDRRTALPGGESEIQYDDKRAAIPVTDRHGYTYVLPYGFDRSGASYFDPATRQSVLMKAEGTETMGGRDVVRFSADVPDADLHAVQQDPYAVIQKPASWFGDFPGVDPAEQLTATLHRHSHHEFFVDEVSGVLVAEQSDITEEYRFAPDVAARSPELAAFALTNLKTTLDTDQETIREASEAASSRAWPVSMWTRIAPIVGGVVGLILLVLGVAALRRSSTRASGPNAP